MSVTRRPGLAISSILFVKILSIRVAVCEVSLVGLVINRTNDLKVAHQVTVLVFPRDFGNELICAANKILHILVKRAI